MERLRETNRVPEDIHLKTGPWGLPHTRQTHSSRLLVLLHLCFLRTNRHTAFLPTLLHIGLLRMYLHVGFIRIHSRTGLFPMRLYIGPHQPHRYTRRTTARLVPANCMHLIIRITRSWRTLERGTDFVQQDRCFPCFRRLYI